MRMRCWILLASLAAPLAAQTPRLVIDGDPGDDLWRDLPPGRLVPSQPAPVSPAGEIRAVVAGRYLCVAARLPEPTGRFTARLTGRNPRILAGANIGYTDRIVQVNPLGAYSVEKAVGVRYRNESTYPYADEWSRDLVYNNIDKFLVASAIRGREWDVEVAIPLSRCTENVDLGR